MPALRQASRSKKRSVGPIFLKPERHARPQDTQGAKGDRPMHQGPPRIAPRAFFEAEPHPAPAGAPQNVPPRPIPGIEPNRDHPGETRQIPDPRRIEDRETDKHQQQIHNADVESQDHHCDKKTQKFLNGITHIFHRMTTRPDRRPIPAAQAGLHPEPVNAQCDDRQKPGLQRQPEQRPAAADKFHLHPAWCLGGN